ncbi:hypothetical protein N9V22_00355 [Gammaproteobacteria bacterium]|nr:hypothetical protein [Gammaproteobacteria bacterium]
MNSKLKINKKLPTYLKRSSDGGLLVGFIYVLTFLSILFLIIWQTFESESNKANEQMINERLLLIEDQLSIVDETNNDSITDISSSIQFLDKEIRKLWDLSNKRNKVNIQNLTKQTADIENLLFIVENDIKTNQEKLKIIEKNLNTNITKVIDLELTAEELEAYKLNLNNIDTQLILLEDSVQALNNYKNQLNQAILEIQTEITIIQQSQDIE